MNNKQIKMLEVLRSHILSCEKCNLHSNGRCGFYFTKKSKYIIIGEAPGKDEVVNEEPFIGKAGRILWETAGEFSLKKEQFAIINTVQCRPMYGNRNGKPSIKQQNTCRPWIRKFYKILKPKAGILFGNYATSAITGFSGITKLNATFIDKTIDADFKTTFLLSIHPSSCIYDQNRYDQLRRSFEVFNMIR